MGKFLDIAETVLRATQYPMKPREISEYALDHHLLDFSEGKTPHQTIKAKLVVDIRTKGAKSRFKRVRPNVFSLRDFPAPEYSPQPYTKTIPHKEDVLAFPSEALDSHGWFHGITTRTRPYRRLVTSQAGAKFHNRESTERNLALKQIVSYVLITRGDCVLRFTRGNYTTAHSLLRGSFCIGFGGHVQSRDMESESLFDPQDQGYLASVHRELHEELRLPRGGSWHNHISLIGALNDDSTELGKKHFAFVHRLRLDYLSQMPDAHLLKGEKSVNRLEWIKHTDLIGPEFPRYEYWSKLCIEKFFRHDHGLDCWIHRVRRFRLKAECPVIVVAGGIGSGKTEASRLLADRYGYEIISTGKILARLMKIPPIPKTSREDFQAKAVRFISSPSGPHQLADAILKQCKQAERAVIDGVRNLATYKLLAADLGCEMATFYIDSMPEQAFRLYANRENRDITMRGFLNLRDHPVERDVPKLLRHANIVVYNYSTKAAYLKRFTAYLREEVER